MTDKLIVHTPCSALSFGQFGFNVLRELYRRKIVCSIFPYGNFDLSPFKVDPQFAAWIEQGINNRLRKFSRDTPTLNLWHLNNSELKLSDRQYTFTFHETSEPTEVEQNIVAQQDHTFFSSSWSVDNFKTYGAKNVSFVPLGLDEDFTIIPDRLVENDITHWLLGGTKFEQRKNTELIIRTWTKRYGGNKAHRLTLAVNNPFFKEEQMNGLYQHVFNGNKPFNINVLPHLKTNAEMRQLYNSADISLMGISGAEGWNIPAMTTTALGKWSIVLNATAHKDWATDSNSILIEPTGMRPVYDNVFFQQGLQFSQGNIFSVTAEQIDEAFTRAEKLAKTPNPEGRKLAETFTYKRTVDEILAKIA